MQLRRAPGDAQSAHARNPLSAGRSNSTNPREPATAHAASRCPPHLSSVARVCRESCFRR
eukprot:6449627-Prymnesium_polylepis.1